jgi:hypothetical protein
MGEVARRERTESLPTAIPAGAQVVVVPGIVGQRERAYPSRTTDLVKRLRVAGVTVVYLESDVPELKLMADEIWLPVMAFIQSVGANVAAQVFIDAVKAQVGAMWPRGKFHAQIARTKTGDKELTVTELDGDGEDVLEAIKQLFPKEQ